MSTTETWPFPTAVMRIPKAHDGALGFAKGVVADMTGNPQFNPSPPELATLASHTDAYDAANTTARGGGVAQTAARKAARAQVETDLKHVRDRVQAVAETQTSAADAAAVILSAGFKVRKVGAHPKPPVRARDGATSGTVVLDALRVAKIAVYYWQFSVNRQDWTDVPETMKAKVVVSGLTPGQTYFFRFRATTPKGPVDFSQVVSLMVR